MNIRILVFAMFATIIVLSSCKKNENFSVSGKITHAEGKTIYIEELLVSKTQIVDSIKINKKGEFKFNAKCGIPTYYLLKLTPEKFIFLLIDSAEVVTVNADYVDFSYDYEVQGSVGSILVKELNEKLNNTRHKLDSLEAVNKLYMGNPDYENLKLVWDEEYKNIVDDQIEYSNNFVMSNPFSMASILALYQKFDDRDPGYIIGDIQVMRTAASALNSIYPKSEHVKALHANTVRLLQDQKNAEIKRFIEENGQNSPEIILPDQNGKEIALSSLRGKVVLLQFWSSADRGSRILNPVLAEVYKKYKNKGFEIYQVSIDENRIDWVDALDKDNMTWINVGDMEGSVLATQIYNIQSIPYNYLLDEEGLIIAQNLKGPGLNKILGEVFK